LTENLCSIKCVQQYKCIANFYDPVQLSDKVSYFMIKVVGVK